GQRMWYGGPDGASAGRGCNQVRWTWCKLSAGRRAGAEPLAVAIVVPCVLIVGAVQEVCRGLATLGVQLLPLGVGEVELGRAHRVGVDGDRAGYGMAGLGVRPVVGV